MSTGRTNPPEPQQLGATPGSLSPPQAPPTPARADRSPGLGLAIGRALGTVVVTVHGELTPASSPQLVEVLRDLIDDQGNLSVVVDARDLVLTSAEGATAFVVAAQWARRHGGTLGLAHAGEPLRRAIGDHAVSDALRFLD